MLCSYFKGRLSCMTSRMALSHNWSIIHCGLSRQNRPTLLWAMYGSHFLIQITIEVCHSRFHNIRKKRYDVICKQCGSPDLNNNKQLAYRPACQGLAFEAVNAMLRPRDHIPWMARSWYKVYSFLWQPKWLLMYLPALRRRCLCPLTCTGEICCMYMYKTVRRCPVQISSRTALYEGKMHNYLN